MRNKKNFKADEQFDRKTTEGSEGLETVKTDVPGAKFQSSQQIQDADHALGMKGADSDYNRKKGKLPGATFKQDVAAKVITGATGGDIPGGATGLRSASYSGDAASNVVGDASSTPIVGRSDRSDTRLGKRFDSTAKHLDQIPSEQILVEFDESKPLAEGQSVQGYNGTYHTESARAQKKSGKIPADLMYVRSLDEIKRDHLYFSSGQVVRATGCDWHDTPTATMVRNADGTYGAPVAGNYSIHRGNYLNKAMYVKIHKDGYISQVSFATDDLSTDDVDSAVANSSSANGIIDVNTAEIDRQNMDTKAGDEKADIWTPLARAVANPSQTVSYLRDLESMTGSEVFMAYKKTAHCMSYNLNKACKDGIKVVSPGLEMAIGLCKKEESSTQYSDTGLVDGAFNAAAYAAGASTLQIAINDSVSKYNTKSKLLMMPLAYRHALQTADNNMDVLRLKPEFAAIVNAEEVFSTIDREYDPILPVCISDKAGIIHPYNFNDLYSFTATSANEGDRTYTKNPFAYGYTDLRNRYVVEARFPLIDGLVSYLSQYAPKIWSLCSTEAGKNVDGVTATANEVIIKIPMVHSTCYFSLWSLLLLEATPYILTSRINSLRDVLYYEKNVEYPFSQLRTIKDLNPTNAMNFQYKSYDEPLVVGRMLPSTAVKWIMPELFIPIDEEAADNTFKFILPWYFNQEQFDISAGKIQGLKDLGAVMSYPSFRSGIRSSFGDILYSMDERELRLCLDRLVTPIHESISSLNVAVYKYGATSDGIPCITFPGSTLTNGAVMSAPRELGWFMVAPAGVLTVNETADGSASSPFYGNASYRAKYWFGRGLDLSASASTIVPTSVSISRASAFKQDWNCINSVGRKTRDAGDPGYVLSVSELFTYGADGAITVMDGKSRFIPFTDGVISSSTGAETALSDTSYALVTLQKAIWARLQLLPFMISPFDVRALTSAAGEDGIHYDPFDFMYWFNCAGFRASDYNEDVYNRISQRNNQGWLFVEDPFMKDSPLFRDAVRYTSV